MNDIIDNYNYVSDKDLETDDNLVSSNIYLKEFLHLCSCNIYYR